jgi:hypothetical protein
MTAALKGLKIRYEKSLISKEEGKSIRMWVSFVVEDEVVPI